MSAEKGSNQSLIETRIARVVCTCIHRIASKAEATHKKVCVF